jgi:hypothetical protein
MTAQEFEKILEERIDDIRKVLSTKKEEYARNGDRLSNFKKAAVAQGITPEKALRGMWFKHVISIVDFIDDLDNGTAHTYSQWNEKITDAINYLILLDALIRERLNQREEIC